MTSICFKEIRRILVVLIGVTGFVWFWIGPSYAEEICHLVWRELPAVLERCREAAWLPSNGQGFLADRFIGWEKGIGLCRSALAVYPDHPVALAALGRALYKTQRYQESRAVIERAAASGHPFGQFALGVLYQYGYGVPKDETQAIEWYRKAAEQGYGEAQRKLGGCMSMDKVWQGTPLKRRDGTAKQRKMFLSKILILHHSQFVKKNTSPNR